jgi:hypothetical protein
MKRFTILLVLAVAGTAAANAYLDNKQTVTHDCAKDPVANVAGNENTITFTGTCKTITAAGNQNTLTIESVASLNVTGNQNTVTAVAVDAINALGNNNTVTWTKGVSGKKPKVASPGNGNKIGAAK